MDKTTTAFFTRNLLKWHGENPRPLPWKDTRDPYIIWLSEIILQQTRVEQGTPYFERFRAKYPSVYDLAQAPEDDVLKMWEGLGYYSRARNLHATAKFISSERNGVFPTTYAEILQLRGVGPYTAAAIASFAYDLPHAVVDGNVFRVLARFFVVETPINSTSGKKQFTRLANQLIPENEPAAFNQAIMNFGALQCKPLNPHCTNCPLNEKCGAYLTNRVDELPVKAKAQPKKNRFFHFLVIRTDEKVFLEKRQDNDIWKGLWQFPLVETDNPEQSFDQVKKLAQNSLIPIPATMDSIKKSPPYKQTLSHQKIQAIFWEIEGTPPYSTQDTAFKLYPVESLSDLAFPRIIDWYLGDKMLYLDLR